MHRLILLLIVVLAAFGCDSGGPDPKVETNRVEAATKMRTMFDKAGGDISRLSAEDRAELLKLFDNKEVDMNQAWSFMANRGQQVTGAPGGGTPGMPGGQGR